MEWLSHFHFIRPWWLLAVLPALAPLLLLRRRRISAGQWQRVVDPQLLPFLLDQQQTGKQQRSASASPLLILAAILTALALAGPAWEKLPQPVQKNQDALIILLDMSASMGAQDLKPSRAVRAIQKITDILRARRDGQTALVVYAGDAHTVTPLTDDTSTIENLLPSLSPFIMPSPGSRPDKAIQLAQQLAADAGVHKARLLLVTDGIRSKDVSRIRDVLQPQRSELSVIALGTAEGAPIPMPGAGFLRDNNGNIVLPGLDPGPLRQLGNELGIRWQTMTLNDDDWRHLLPERSDTENNAMAPAQRYDLWVDQGYWLILLLIPLSLLLFRRGVLLSLLLVPALWPGNTWALEWQDLWQTKDQQAQALMDNHQPAEAARTFTDPQWQGSAAYRAGDYEAAAKAFAQAEPSAHSQYNLGNALAGSGRLEEAAAAYQKALQMQPGFPAAQENLEKVEQARKQQQQQSQDGQSSDQQQGQNQEQNQSGQQGQKQDQQGQSGEQGQKQDQQGQSGQQGQKQDQQGQSGQQGQKQDQQSQSGQQGQKQDQQGQSGEQGQDAQQNSTEQQQSPEEQQKGASAASAQQADNAAEDDTQQQSAQPLGKDGKPLSREEREAMQQWLNRVPDQPGNLLQRKFLYQYRQQNDQESEDVLW